MFLKEFAERIYKAMNDLCGSDGYGSHNIKPEIIIEMINDEEGEYELVDIDGTYHPCGCESDIVLKIRKKVSQKEKEEREQKIKNLKILLEKQRQNTLDMLNAVGKPARTETRVSPTGSWVVGIFDEKK